MTQSISNAPSDKVYKKLVPQTGSDGTTIDVEITVDDRDDDEKDIDKMIFNEQVKQWIKDCSRLEATERSLFEIIWDSAAGSCRLPSKQKMSMRQSIKMVT